MTVRQDDAGEPPNCVSKAPMPEMGVGWGVSGDVCGGRRRTQPRSRIGGWARPARPHLVRQDLVRAIHCGRGGDAAGALHRMGATALPEVLACCLACATGAAPSNIRLRRLNEPAVHQTQVDAAEREGTVSAGINCLVGTLEPMR